MASSKRGLGRVAWAWDDVNLASSPDEQQAVPDDLQQRRVRCWDTDLALFGQQMVEDARTFPRRRRMRMYTAPRVGRPEQSDRDAACHLCRRSTGMQGHRWLPRAAQPVSSGSWRCTATAILGPVRDGTEREIGNTRPPDARNPLFEPDPHLPRLFAGLHVHDARATANRTILGVGLPPLAAAGIDEELHSRARRRKDNARPNRCFRRPAPFLLLRSWASPTRTTAPAEATRPSIAPAQPTPARSLRSPAAEAAATALLARPRCQRRAHRSRAGYVVSTGGVGDGRVGGSLRHRLLAAGARQRRARCRSCRRPSPLARTSLSSAWVASEELGDGAVDRPGG